MDFTFAEWMGIVSGVVIVAFFIKKMKNKSGGTGSGGSTGSRTGTTKEK